jgi:hypothetical protein
MKTNSKKNQKDKTSILERSLKQIPINKLSKESGFCKRRAKKIKPKELLIGFFMMVFSSEGNSYKNWASKIGLLIKDTISKQALEERMQPEIISFLQKVLNGLAGEKINRNISKQTEEKLKEFENVIIEDSTNIKVSDKFWDAYPGNGYWNQSDKKAILKIQACYNILKKNFMRFEITSFRKNDQGYAGKIFDIIDKGDLLIRDLGYFVLKVFKQLDQAGVYFISRMRKGVKIISKEDDKPIDLAAMLKKRGHLDIEAFLGEEERLPIRLIAIPVDTSTAAERRRKCKTNRDRRLSPSKESLYLLGWELFITNVPKEKLVMENIAEIYFIRWRIEIIFKCWKSYFKIIDIPKGSSQIRLDSYIYCMLIFIMIFQINYYNYYSYKRIKDNPDGSQLSMMKMMQFISSCMLMLCLPMYYELKCEKLLEKHLIYYSMYETRHDRLNFYQKFQKLT